MVTRPGPVSQKKGGRESIRAGRVAELWRYPVKSTGGEPVDLLRCLHRGAEGDRTWAVRGSDGKLGSGKTTRRFSRMPGLLELGASTLEDGTVQIQFPSGELLAADDPRAARLVSERVGAPVTLVRESAVSHLDDAPLHLLTTGSLRWLNDLRPNDQIEIRRFRPNVLIDTADGDRPEESWLGRELFAGGVRMRVSKRTERCVMVTLEQPHLGFAAPVLRTLQLHADECLGVYAEVVVEGVIRRGDDVFVARR